LKIFFDSEAMQECTSISYSHVAFSIRGQ